MVSHLRALLLASSLIAPGAAVAASIPPPSFESYGADPRYGADSTAAINAAFAAGQPVTCNGIYKVSGPIRLNALPNLGQRLAGSGANDSANLTTANRCIIRPATGMTGPVFVIDGTPFAGYMQSAGLAGITIDMANMTDVATNIAIQQIESFDIVYDDVRVINYGAQKLSWQFQAGSYVTDLRDSQGGLVSFVGSTSNNATTIKLDNTDLTGIQTNNAFGITLIGGAIQFRYVAGVTPVIWVPSTGIGPYGVGFSGAGAGGVYMAYETDIKNTQHLTVVGTDFENLGSPPPTCALTGWTYGTYNDGVHGCAPIVMGGWIEPTAKFTHFVGANISGMYFYDQGVASQFDDLSQNGVYGFRVYTGTSYELGDAHFGGMIEGSSGFQGALNSDASHPWSINAATGAALFPSLTIKPATDGAAINISSASGVSEVQVYTYGTGGLQFNNGAGLYLFSDTGSTQAGDLVSVSGAGRLDLKNPSASANNLTLNSINGTVAGNGGGSVYNLQINPYTPSLTNVSELQAGGHRVLSDVVPVVASGFSTGTPTLYGYSTAAFTVVLGATPASTGSLTMPAAPQAWNCEAQDWNTTAAVIAQTGGSTTSATFKLSGLGSGDNVHFLCMAQ
jgi:hypothetical protein